MKVWVSVRDLWIKYGRRVALEGVNLDTRGPGLVIVMGPNGAGKTTLLRALLGLVKPFRGRVIINDVDVTGSPAAAGRFAGYVPQPGRWSTRFPVTPLELVLIGLKLRSFRGDPLQRAAESLEMVGLPREVWEIPLSSLSGGMAQRVMIARALAWDPLMLVLDEPFSAVDARGRGEIAELLGQLSEERLVIVALHDPTFLLDYADLVVVLGEGRVVSLGPPEEALRPDVLRSVYGASLIVFDGHVHVGDSHVHT